jgi:TM2 domain-containing membrane protein YozV
MARAIGLAVLCVLWVLLTLSWIDDLACWLRDRRKRYRPCGRW